MRVLYIADTYEIGGAFLAFIDLIDSITESHKDIVPLVLSSKRGKNNEYAESRGIENYDVGHKAFIMNNGSTIPRRLIRIITRPLLKVRYEFANKKAIRTAEKLIDFSNVDIIHSNSDRNDVGAILAKKHNIPHVWHLREFAEECFTLKRDYIDFMNDHADCFIAISQAVANEWIKKGLQPDKICIVYDGVGLPIVGDKKEKNNDIVKGVIAGFISPFKGQYDLLKSMNLIKKDLKNRFCLDIYGHAAFEYLLKLKIYVLTHGLKEMVKFKGYVNGIEKLYSDYDIGFMCSKAEGFGRVTVEYLMNRLCVIASDTGANPEIIDNGINGYIYKYKDKSDLAKKIQHIIAFRGEARECAERGYEAAVERFTKKINADNVYGLYCELLKSKKTN